MKSKDLIAKLQAIDPEGEMEVTIGKQDIFSVYSMPRYWDGCVTLLNRDSALAPYYDVTGATISSEGMHICLKSLPLDMLLLDDPEAPITFADEYARQHFAQYVAEKRKEAQLIIEEQDGKAV